jgi:hypothetical protein
MTTKFIQTLQNLMSGIFHILYTFGYYNLTYYTFMFHNTITTTIHILNPKLYILVLFYATR